MRYSQLRWFDFLGAVNAVPETCSAYKPSGHFLGLFPLTGSAPLIASDDTWFPKPFPYSRSS